MTTKSGLARSIADVKNRFRRDIRELLESGRIKLGGR
jgi:hypothetical protein